MIEKIIIALLVLYILVGCKEPSPHVVVEKSIVGDRYGTPSFVVLMREDKTGKIRESYSRNPNFYVSVEVGDKVMY